MVHGPAEMGIGQFGRAVLAPDEIMPRVHKRGQVEEDQSGEVFKS